MALFSPDLQHQENPKAKQRREIKRNLEFLEPSWVSRESIEVVERLSAFLAVMADRSQVLFYLATFPGEIALGPLAEELIRTRRVFFPFIRKGSPDMEFTSVESWPGRFVKGATGALEPETRGSLFSASDASHAVVLVPGLAFSENGSRLGRGGGFYDRFLGQAMMGESVSIGVCFENQIRSDIRFEAHDVRVKWVCTEKRIFQVDVVA